MSTRKVSLLCWAAFALAAAGCTPSDTGSSPGAGGSAPGGSSATGAAGSGSGGTTGSGGRGTGNTGGGGSGGVRGTGGGPSTGSGGTCGTSCDGPDPCAGLCDTATSFGRPTTGAYYTSPPLGPGPACYVTTDSISYVDFPCITGRTYSVNGATVPCATASPGPARNGGYCLQISAGNTGTGGQTFQIGFTSK